MSAVVLGSSTPKVGTFRPFYGVPLVNCASQNRRGRQRFSIVCEYDRGQCYRRPARLLSNGTGPLVARERNSFRSPSPTTRPLRRRARRMLPGSILNAAVAQQVLKGGCGIVALLWMYDVSGELWMICSMDVTMVEGGLRLIGQVDVSQVERGGLITWMALHL